MEEHPTRTTSTCARIENRPRKRKTAPHQTQHEVITEITRIEIESTAQRARGGEGLLSHRFAVPGLRSIGKILTLGEGGRRGKKNRGGEKGLREPVG